MIFFGYEDFVDTFWGSSQNWTIFLCILGPFLRSRYRMGDIFWGWLNFKYFLGCLKFLIFN